MIIDLGAGAPKQWKTDASHVVDIKERGHRRGVKFVKHDLQAFPYPFEDETAEKIYADNVFEHLNVTLFDFLSECKRILTQGGVLVFKTPNVYFIKKRVEFLLFKKYPSYHPDHVSALKPSFVHHVMTLMGFEVCGNKSDSFAHMTIFTGRKR